MDLVLQQTHIAKQIKYILKVSNSIQLCTSYYINMHDNKLLVIVNVGKKCQPLNVTLTLRLGHYVCIFAECITKSIGTGLNQCQNNLSKWHHKD